MKHITITAILSIAAIFAGAVAMAHGGKHKESNLKAENGWTRATTGEVKTSAAYLTLVNRGETMDRLIGAFSPVARDVEFHTPSMKDGVMSTHRVEALTVHPGKPLVLRPGGAFVVLTGVKRPLKEGSTFPLIMNFENAGSVVATIEVRKAARTEPRMQGGGAMHGHDKMKMNMGKPEIPKNLDTAATKLSASKRFKVSVSSHLDPVVINRMHSWTLRITTRDGKPVKQARIEIEGGMPAHGHALPTAPRVTREIGGGEYLVEGMKFNMAGWWQLRFAISKDGQRDNVAFNLVLGQ